MRERIRVTGYRLQVTGYRLQVTGYRLQVTGVRVRAVRARTRRRVNIKDIVRQGFELGVGGGCEFG